MSLNWSLAHVAEVTDRFDPVPADQDVRVLPRIAAAVEQPATADEGRLLRADESRRRQEQRRGQEEGTSNHRSLGERGRYAPTT